MTTAALRDIDIAKPSRKRGRYPRYTPTGVAWQGEMPAGWTLKRMKFAVSLVNKKKHAAECELPYIGLENIESWTGRYIPGQADESADGLSSAFDTDDVLFGKLRPYLAKALQAPSPGVCSSELLVLRARDVIPRYLFYYALSSGFVRVVDSSTYGAKMPRASWGFIGNLPLLIPPLDEQRAIAAFLDRDTANLDGLIAKKQQLIMQLAIKREAKMESVFTSQRDDSVRLPIKRLLTFTTSGSRGWAEFYSDEGDLFIQSGNLNRRLGLDLSVVQRIVPPEGAEAQRTMIQRGDVLVCITGAYTGNISVVDFDPPRAFINQHVALLRVRHQIVAPKFVAYFLASSLGQGHFKASQYGGTKQGLGFEDIHSIPIPLPPLDEQLRIVRQLDSDLRAIEEMAAVTDAGIANLREYRSSLISAAVTGQIDVRNYREEALCQ